MPTLCQTSFVAGKIGRTAPEILEWIMRLARVSTIFFDSGYIYKALMTPSNLKTNGIDSTMCSDRNPRAEERS